MANELNISDINYLNIFPHVGKPCTINIRSIEPSAGVLKAGNYVLLVRYLDGFNTPTNFFTSSMQVAVPLKPPGQERSIGAEGETSTNYAIRFSLTNIDLAYDRVQVAVIPQFGGVIGTPLLLPAQVITGSSMSFIYTGEETATESSLEELLIDGASYQKAKAITQVDGSLYLGNMSRYEEFNYQPYANNIKVKTTIKEYDDPFNIAGLDDFNITLKTAEGNIGAPTELVYNAKGLKRGETYALYVSFIFSDGHESPAFHIPGREADTFTYEGNTYEENSVIPASETILRGIAGTDSNGNTAAKWFQFVSKPHPVYGTGYWENKDERYPYSTDWEIWDVNDQGIGFFTGRTLSGKPVRHHQMPDNEYEPFYSDNQNKIRVLGIELENLKIPESMQDRVRAVRVHFAKRTLNNQRVVDQSFAIRPSQNDDPAEENYTSRVSNAGILQLGTAPGVEFFTPYIFHPFNSLRLKQNIQGITHMKGVGYIEDYKKFGPSGGDITRVYENLISGFIFGLPNEEDRFKKVDASSYIPSYGFNEEDAANSIVRISDAGFLKDYDNSNGEEKLLFRIQQMDSGGSTETPYAVPDYMYEMCQLKDNVYINFDLQNLVFTGFQTSDIDSFRPAIVEDGSPSPSIAPEYSTGPIFGGDTFIGIWVSRHSKWVKKTEDVLISLRYSLVETYAFPDYRSPGTQVYEVWYPGDTQNLRSYASIIWKDGKPVVNSKDGDVFPNNMINYNEDFLMNESAKPAIPFPKRRSSAIKLPTRIIRSRQEQNSEEDTDLFRQFRDQDFLDLPTNRGAINRLTNLNNLLIPHLDYSLFRTKGKEELALGDTRAFLGSGDIFEFKPEELYETDLGHAGLQDYNAGVVTEYGYFFVDQESRKVFHLTREGLSEVSSEGLEQFFLDSLEFNFEYLGFTNFRGASQFFGIEVSWDAEYKRYILTKRDIKFNPDFDESQTYTSDSGDSPSPSGSPVPLPLPEELEFSEDTQSFVDPEDFSQRLSWDDERYFVTDSFTISYSPEINAWISFHDYFPDMYFYNHESLFSSYRDILYKHNDKTQRGLFFDELFPSYIEYIDNSNPSVANTVAALYIETEVEDQQGQSVQDKTVSSVRVRNSYQDTGDIITQSFIEFEGVVRKAQGFWRVNQLRNALNTEGVIDQNKEWYDKEWLSDRYHYVKLSFDNSSGETIYIISSELNIKTSLR